MKEKNRKGICQIQGQGLYKIKKRVVSIFSVPLGYPLSPFLPFGRASGQASEHAEWLQLFHGPFSQMASRNDPEASSHERFPHAASFSSMHAMLGQYCCLLLKFAKQRPHFKL